MNKAIVFDIQRCSMEDGPGIRTTVFLKGCPLRCKWCHNPESFSREIQSVTLPNGRPKLYGQEMSATEVFELVQKDIAFYQNSGGGLTVSGGEPLLWPEFLQELFGLCREAGISTAIETSGVLPFDKWSGLLPYINLFLYDFKAFPEEKHIALTGVSLKEILSNLQKLIERNKEVILRCPLIPGQNLTDAYLQKIAELSKEHNLMVNVEPYHNTARDKWQALDLRYQLPKLASMTQKEAEEVVGQIIAYGAPRTSVQFA